MEVSAIDFIPRPIFLQDFIRSEIDVRGQDAVLHAGLVPIDRSIFKVISLVELVPSKSTHCGKPCTTRITIFELPMMLEVELVIGYFPNVLEAIHGKKQKGQRSGYNIYLTLL